MIFGAAAVVWSAFLAGAAGTAVVRARRRIRAVPRPAGEETLARTLLVRPCAGAEPDLARRLALTGGAPRVVLAVESLADGAATAAVSAVADLRQRGVDAHLVATHARGPNHKADQIACALRAARRTADYVAIADSDVELRDDDIACLVGELEARDLAAVWAPPIEDPSDPRSVSAAVLNGSMHAFAALSGIDRAGFVGKLFVVRATALEAIGGFDALVDRLGEDMELARRLRERGESTAPSSVLARARPREDSVGALVDRLSRWVLVIRAQRPLLLASYPLLLAAAPLATALMVCGLVLRDPLLAAAGAVALVVRSLVAVVVPMTTRSAVAPLLAVAADVVLLRAFARALVTRTLAWRGRSLRIGPGGRLELASEAADHPREHTLCDVTEHSRLRLLEHREAVRARRCEPSVDPREGRRDAFPLPRELDLRSARGHAWRSDRDPEVRTFAPVEDVAHADAHDLGATSDPRDERRSGLQLERRERRTLTALGVDPDETPAAGEELGRMTDGACAVGGIGEIDAECSDLAEEREPSQVRRVHHRVRVGAEDDVREPQRDERIPPRRMVRDDEHRTARASLTQVVEPAHEHTPEGADDPRSGVAREERGEPGALARADQGGAS